MYDQDSSGEITPDEMVEIFSLMYAVQVLLSVKNTAVNEKEDDNCFSQHNMYIPRAAQKERERRKPRRFLRRWTSTRMAKLE